MRNSNQLFFPVLLTAVIFIAGCGQTGPAENSATTTTASHDSATAVDKHANTPTTPINLQRDSSVMLNPPMRIIPRMVPTQMRVSIDDSHGLEHVNMTVNALNITNENVVAIEGAPCQFVKFHFHCPSEHLYAGRAYPMEMHIVFRLASRPDSTIVIGIPMDTARIANAFINSLWQSFSAVLNSRQAQPANISLASFDYNRKGLEVYVRDYWNYVGSLTTPDYGKVNWFVSNTPYLITPAQLDTFASFRYDNHPLGPAIGIRPIGARTVGRSFQMKYGGF